MRASIRFSDAHCLPIVLVHTMVVAVVVIIGSGCATSTSTVAASTYRQFSLYRSASAAVRQPPDHSFELAAAFLLERGDIEITHLNEAHRQCTAVAGDRTLTFRVIDAGSGRSRLSMLVGGVEDDAVDVPGPLRRDDLLPGQPGVAGQITFGLVGVGAGLVARGPHRVERALADAERAAAARQIEPSRRRP